MKKSNDGRNRKGKENIYVLFVTKPNAHKHNKQNPEDDFRCRVVLCSSSLQIDVCT